MACKCGHILPPEQILHKKSKSGLPYIQEIRAMLFFDFFLIFKAHHNLHMSNKGIPILLSLKVILEYLY
ncbi:MAG: hypothetical protein EAZ14_05300 [Runella slithyformis]|nr:MAG: hypothetical protein EAZ46_01145 [Runella sp.]TAG22980.1 MAG: hypothetical protein EAZ38_04255 [Cytophagales bacterium]TAG42035.1 MAG: hypothetical protein EAZ32_01780 [Cytophagia bacterium]TAG52808.1 MAG: hypothetical protein EAZ29_06695 [Runella slithyformis]TAG83734.1 MAG: hypothetical protein EAZ22_01845 [Cytophagales bacterium]